MAREVGTQRALGMLGVYTLGGSPLKLMNALLVTALVLFTVGVVRADDIGGGDSQVVLGGGPHGSPSCTGFQATADGSGLIEDPDGGPAGCAVDNGEFVTSITFAVPNADTLDGLTVTSPLTTTFAGTALSFLDWTETGNCTGAEANTAPGGIDVCTLTAPALPSGPPGTIILADLTALGIINDGDCNTDDFIFGIPGGGVNGTPLNEGCDITFATVAGATDENTKAFVSGAVFDVSPTGTGGLVPFPEPGSLALLMLGLLTLPFLRRRVRQ